MAAATLCDRGIYGRYPGTSRQNGWFLEIWRRWQINSADRPAPLRYARSWDYAPVNDGARFSLNAFTASAWSEVNVHRAL